MNIIQSDIKTMDSSELRDLINECRLGVEQPIRLNKLNEKIVDELEGEHYTKSVVQNSNNTESVIYHLTVEQCTLIGMRESKTVRRSILAKLKELESNQVPKTYAAALIEAGRLAQVAEEQAEQLAIAAPKVEFHDTVVNSTHTFSIRDAAKKINQRPIKFGEWLKEFHYTCLNGRASQKYIDMGLFVTHTGISESDHAYTQTRMTGKGCAYFNNKLFEIKL